MSQPDLFNPTILSVSELTNDIKQLLEGTFLDIKIEGEVSNAKASISGHIYFTLKDEFAQLSCVIWRSTAERMGLELNDGQQIIAGGDISVYPPHGRYQLVVRSVEQSGTGALLEAFEKLKIRLKEEGLFDVEHKMPLPKFPQKIGVITSATGAAFHDICGTLQQRWPVARIFLHHSSVQGVNAAPGLVAAINWFSQKQNIDILIVGRGGGSLEDLWPFNEETVARALFDCNIPTISAVGHEVDFSISDFVADARAATPTQAAVIAAPDINEMRIYVDGLINELKKIITNRISNHENQIEQLLRSYALQALEEKITAKHERIKNLSERLHHRYKILMMSKKERLSSLMHKIKQNNPNAPLEKGYVRVEQGEEWIKKANLFDCKETFEMIWEDERVRIEQ